MDDVAETVEFLIILLQLLLSMLDSINDAKAEARLLVDLYRGVRHIYRRVNKARIKP